MRSAAQYFHLLHRQVALRHLHPRPLVLMAPKSLLRHPLAASPLAAFRGMYGTRPTIVGMQHDVAR